MTATYASTSKWAPGFWTQQQQPASSATWSPRGSLESEEGSGDSAGNHYSDDARYRSPRGSIALGGPPTISSRRSRRGSSPWEIVKYPETRSYPRSPTRSRPGTPPLAPEPAFFEDTAVPDSDELTVAARRSLSLRMSRNSFKQADPLPETDDPPVSAKAGRRWGSSRSQMDGNDGATDAERGRRRFHLGALESPGRPLQSSAPQGAMSPSTTSTKRRSLLRAFNSSQSNSVSLGALQQQSQAQQDDAVLQTPRPTWVVSDTSSIESSSSRDRTQLAHHQNSSRDSNTTTSTTKKSRKWWSSMLN
ncbi:hypothetical protein FBU59_003371 [Linderina macrospora]|uniref:Uncharacterized protein n=1 Tax=Linderina macrospora TaxID=4868 RepID=A0ACC1J8H6_9FUNG|nr:hypothetical protein FBU59_003371 [Linderina macrospora]